MFFSFSQKLPNSFQELEQHVLQEQYILLLQLAGATCLQRDYPHYHVINLIVTKKLNTYNIIDIIYKSNKFN